MSIIDKINYLYGTKLDIKEAIINKGVQVSDDDTFRSYADKIESIQSGGGINSLSTVDGDMSNHINRIYSESEVV